MKCSKWQAVSFPLESAAPRRGATFTGVLMRLVVSKGRCHRNGSGPFDFPLTCCERTKRGLPF